MGKYIMLDNGHGFDTPGKRSPKWPDGQQLFEWEFNRSLAEKIERRLKVAGIPCVRIVPESMDIPLSVRCQRANDIYRKHPEAILISIHANAGGGSGFEIFTSPGVTKSDAIATRLIEQLERDFPSIKMRKDMEDGDPDKEANFYILRRTDCPAILAENLFMDNEKDCRLLLSDEFRNRLADSYVSFIKGL